MKNRVSSRTAAGELMRRVKRQALLRSKALSVLLVLIAIPGLVFAVTPAMAAFGVERVAISARNQNGTPDVQAGSHPYALTATFVLTQPPCTESEGRFRCVAEGLLKDARVELPPGFVGDPNATPRCTYQEFISPGVGCSSETAVGVATAYLGRELQAESPANADPVTEPVYNLVPSPGVVAEFGYIVAGVTPVLLQSSVRTGGDYGLTTSASDINQAILAYASKVTIWGVPASPAHNPLRGGCERQVGGDPTSLDAVGSGLSEGEDELEGPIYPFGSDTGLPESEGECKTQAPQLPLLTMPTSCGELSTATLRVDSWEEPGNFSGSRTQTVKLPSLEGCEKLEFSPSIEAKPEASSGSTPSELGVSLKVPQERSETAGGLAESDVRDTTITLPLGMQLSPSAANGLQACAQLHGRGSEAAEENHEVSGINLETKQPANCPDASKLADVHVKSPDLEHELVGGMYLAAPQNFAGVPENPFSSLTAVYLVAEDPVSGVLVKLAGNVTRSETGQLTTTFENTPELPFSELVAEFFGGEGAPLATPAFCGTYTTTASFTPYSGGAAATPTATFAIDSGPGGSACPVGVLPFAPSATGGSLNTNAGAFSPFSMTLSRGDGQQSFQSAVVHLPEGVAAILTGVPLCAEAQANAGTCGAGSLIGETTVSAGLGNDPYTIKGGKVYLTEKYAGAPFGLSIVDPAAAGPLVLQEGRPVVTRAKLEVNPRTGQVTVTTGQIPQIIEGFPLQLKHINVLINRPSFGFNPTSCEPTTGAGTVLGWEGASSEVSVPFQVGDCANLAFNPTIAVSTGAHSSKKDGASLNIKVGYPSGALGTQAWFKEAKLVIPKQLPAELKTIQQACLAATFEANPASCPVHSKIGEAIVHTQVLPVPLKGPIYFVSYGAAKFPDAIILLSGDNVNVRLTSETFIKNGVTSVTLPEIPGVPVESAEFNLPTGEYSEFGTNLGLGDYDFCGQKMTVPTEFKAQNGLEFHQETPVTVTGCPASVSIQSKSIKKRTLTLTVYAPAAGKLTATGHGLTTRTKTAKGQELLTFTLTPKKTTKLKTKINITYTPTKGKKQTTTTTITFKR
jgi:hypothetical protein